MKNNILFSIVSLCIAFPFNVFAGEIGTFSKTEFSPSRGEFFSIPYSLEKSAKVAVDIYTADNNLVRTLDTGEEPLPAGDYTAIWDGRDEEKIVVPDEAYTVVLRTIVETGEKTFDSRLFSGGEIEKNLQSTASADGTVSFYLTKPARVLVRAGISGGPMLNSLLNWEPRAAGKNIIRWHGMDSSNVINLLEKENYAVSVTAFRLPEFSIITTGNRAIDYAEYFRMKHWTFTPIPENLQLLERGTQGISPHYYYQRLADKDPDVEIHFPASIKKNDAGLPILTAENPIPVKVTMDEEDEQLIAETKYEVTFFVDNAFMSEEELGFMPITWLWQPNNLSSGQHTLTVNVSGFAGQVGVKTVAFMIE